MNEPADRLHERLDVEEPLVLERFPHAHLDRVANTIMVRDYILPPGWSHDATDVLFAFPMNYPAGCPDNVCVRPDLRLADGQLPGNNQGVVVHAGREWLQLSWHIEPADWKPTTEPTHGSNLVTYLIGALSRFEESS